MDSFTETQIKQIALQHMERVDYPPVEELKANAIQSTVAYCSSIFGNESPHDIYRVVEQVWPEYVKNKKPY